MGYPSRCWEWEKWREWELGWYVKWKKVFSLKNKKYRKNNYKKNLTFCSAVFFRTAWMVSLLISFMVWSELNWDMNGSHKYRIGWTWFYISLSFCHPPYESQYSQRWYLCLNMWMAQPYSPLLTPMILGTVWKSSKANNSKECPCKNSPSKTPGMVLKTRGVLKVNTEGQSHRYSCSGH